MTITAEQAAKLLEGTTPGPWLKEDAFGVRGSDGNYVANFGFGPDTEAGDAVAEANTALGAAAPVLARALIASEAARDALAERLENEMADLDAADRRATRLQARLVAVEERLAKAVGALATIADIKRLASYGDPMVLRKYARTIHKEIDND